MRRPSSVSIRLPHGLAPGRAFAFAAVTFLLLLLLVPPVRAAVLLGTAVGVLPAAVAQLGGEEVTILLGSQLFEGQTIVTSPVGEVQIVFVDDTRMVIGPNSSLVIERILMRDSTSFSSLVTNALGGTFRFITGNSPHSAYQMNTPAGTIAVRGTAYDVTIEALTRRVDVMVYLGGVELCPPLPGRCVVIEQRCAVGNLVATGASIIRSEGLRMEIAGTLFPYLDELIQAGLHEDFQVADAADCGDRQAQAPENTPAVVPVEAVIVPADVPPPPPPPPPPSSGEVPDECKNGGWEALSFRNQGQCVREETPGAELR